MNVNASASLCVIVSVSVNLRPNDQTMAWHSICVGRIQIWTQMFLVLEEVADG